MKNSIAILLILFTFHSNYGQNNPGFQGRRISFDVVIKPNKLSNDFKLKPFNFNGGMDFSLNRKLALYINFRHQGIVYTDKYLKSWNRVEYVDRATRQPLVLINSGQYSLNCLSIGFKRFLPLLSSIAPRGIYVKFGLESAFGRIVDDKTYAAFEGDSTLQSVPNNTVGLDLSNSFFKFKLGIGVRQMIGDRISFFGDFTGNAIFIGNNPFDEKVSLKSEYIHRSIQTIYNYRNIFNLSIGFGYLIY